MSGNIRQLDTLGRYSRLERAKLTYEKLLKKVGVGNNVTHFHIRELSSKIVHPNSTSKNTALDVQSSVLYAVIRILIGSGALQETNTDLVYLLRHVKVDSINEDGVGQLDKQRAPYFKEGMMVPFEWENVVNSCKTGSITKVEDIEIKDESKLLFDVVLRDPYTKDLYRCKGIHPDYSDNVYGHVEVTKYKE